FVCCSIALPISLAFFFFNATAPTEIYTLSLHDALPISRLRSALENARPARVVYLSTIGAQASQANLLRQHTIIERSLSDLSVPIDRKSTRLNSSHDQISYAVFCLKKKKKKKKNHIHKTS